MFYENVARVKSGAQQAISHTANYAQTHNEQVRAGAMALTAMYFVNDQLLGIKPGLVSTLTWGAWLLAAATNERVLSMVPNSVKQAFFSESESVQSVQATQQEQEDISSAKSHAM